jgi:2-polyprenyl-3-methyl-5-hydroxy-6-metoxy-1,4-benzoquinol methylase
MARVFETHASDSAYNAHYDRPAVLGLVGEVEGLHVLDAGCGPGPYAEELLARGADVVAVDESEPMVELAKRRLGSRAVVLRADLNESLPFADDAFDVVLCPLVIHHVVDRTATLREFFRVLRIGGRVVLSTQHPTTDWLRKGGSYFDIREEVDVWERDGTSYAVHFWREPLTSLCAAVADAGFLIERLVEPLPADSMRERWPETWESCSRGRVSCCSASLSLSSWPAPGCATM